VEPSTSSTKQDTNPLDWHDDAWPEPEDISDKDKVNSDSDSESGSDYHEDLAQFIAAFNRDEYDLLPSLGDPGPQTQSHRKGQRLVRVLSRALLEDEDARIVEDLYPQAGKVTRRQSPSPPVKDFNGDTVMGSAPDAAKVNLYAPFD
jgi:hypothetical protein